jgi:hypothetical protein
VDSRIVVYSETDRHDRTASLHPVDGEWRRAR